MGKSLSEEEDTPNILSHSSVICKIELLYYLRFDNKTNQEGAININLGRGPEAREPTFEDNWNMHLE